MDSSSEYLPVPEAQPSTSAAVLSERKTSSSPTEVDAQTEKDTKGKYFGLRAWEAVKHPIQTLKKCCLVPEQEQNGSFESLYKVGKRLAWEPFSKVYKGIRKSDDKQVIIKIAEKLRFNFHAGNSKPWCREVAVMLRVEHSEHVIKLHEWFDEKDQYILIMEYPETSITLLDFIKENGGSLTEAVAKDIMKKLIAALQHCRDRDVYYRNISPREVVIIKDTMQIKLTGFNGARINVQRRREESGLKSEGIILANDDLYDMLWEMVQGNGFGFGWKNTRLSKEGLDFLKMLHDRVYWITLQEILDHDWFKQSEPTDEKPAKESKGKVRALFQKKWKAVKPTFLHHDPNRVVHLTAQPDLDDPEPISVQSPVRNTSTL